MDTFDTPIYGIHVNAIQTNAFFIKVQHTKFVPYKIRPKIIFFFNFFLNKIDYNLMHSIVKNYTGLAQYQISVQIKHSFIHTATERKKKNRKKMKKK